MALSNRLTRETTAQIERWSTPASAYPRASSGAARIRTAWYAPGVYDCYGTGGYGYYEALRRLKVTTLTIDGSVWMVDDPPHWWGMREHAQALSGHVLCAGLGLGLMVHALDANDAVKQITVIEREPAVIDLVAPLLPQRKLTVVCAEWDAYEPSEKVDGVLYDLFVGGGFSLMDGVEVADRALRRFAELDLVRVHGFPNPLVQAIAAARIEAERWYYEGRARSESSRAH